MARETVEIHLGIAEKRLMASLVLSQNRIASALESIAKALDKPNLEEDTEPP